MWSPEDDGIENYDEFQITVDAQQKLLRIDKFLMDKIPNLSRSKLQEGIKSGHVFVNGTAVKNNYKVHPLDAITVYLLKHPDQPTEIIPQDIPLNVVYEDDYLMIVNKPPGMVVHPGFNNWTNTLVNALAFRFSNLPTHRNGEEKPGLVHRIDKDTSGLLVIAKTDEAMAGLAKQFQEHTIERTYYALVWGEPKEEKGTVIGNIGRSLQDRRVSVVYEDPEIGKHAVTHYEVLKNYRYVTLVKCNLETGRTHQIRVHMKHIGHTLFNDELYGGNKILKGHKFSKYRTFVENCFKILPRQALHAKSLGFIHPITKETMQFESELPEDFQAALDKWDHYVQYN